MKMYQLKDKNLQKLCENTFYDFANRFHKAAEGLVRESRNDTNNALTVFTHFKGMYPAKSYERNDVFGRSQLLFLGDSFESVVVYDPNGWNRYPLVIPPNNHLMMIECEDGKKYCGKYENGYWMTQDNEPLWRENKVKFFRSWPEITNDD